MFFYLFLIVILFITDRNLFDRSAKEFLSVKLVFCTMNLFVSVHILEYRETIKYSVIIISEVMFDSLKQSTIQTRVVVKECLVEEYPSLFNLDLDSWVFLSPFSFEATSQLDGWLCRLLIKVSN